MIADAACEAELVERERVYEGGAFDFVSDAVRLSADTPPVRRDYLDHPGAVAIVAVREGSQGQPQVCLVNQYRHPVRARLWEVPAGLTDVAGEGLLEAAQRELYEEAGLAADRWDTLVDFFTSPGCSSEGLRVFLARGLRERTGGYVRRDEEADMDSRFVDLDEVIAVIFAGRVHNPSLLVGAFALQEAARAGFAGLRAPDAAFAPRG